MMNLIEDCTPQGLMQMQCQQQAEEQFILFLPKYVSGSTKKCENSYAKPELPSLSTCLTLLPPFASHPPLQHPPLQHTHLKPGAEALLGRYI